MKKSIPNYWMYLALVSIVFNVFLAAQLYMPPTAPSTNNKAQTKETGMQESKETLLFVQESDGAAIKKNDDGTYTLDLNASPEILFFTDRPYRQAGQMANDEFINMLNATKSDPPNAILLMNAMGEYRNVPVEILEGEINPDSSTTRYTIRTLNFNEEDLYADLGVLIENGMELDAATLFIDALPTPVNGQITDSVEQTLIINDGKQDKPADIKLSVQSDSTQSDLEPGKTLPNMEGSSFPPTEDVVPLTPSEIGTTMAGDDSTDDTDNAVFNQDPDAPGMPKNEQ